METEKWIVVIVTSSDQKFNGHLIGKDHDKFKSFQSLPKALYPIAGVPLIDTWLSKISQASLSFTDVYIVTNQNSHSKMMEWGQSRSIPSRNILISDVGGEVGALRMMIREHEEIVVGNNILVINSDVLVDCDFSFTHFLSQLSVGMCLSYNGIIQNHDLNILVDDRNRLIFDSSNEIHNSHLIPVYSIPSSSSESLKALPEVITSSHDLLRLLCGDHHIDYQTTPVTHYYPMDSVEYFDHATTYFEDSYRETFSHLPSHVNIVCPARAGLMGNPSDGFHGKTLSFIVNNFFAQVTITSNPDLSVELIPHPVFDITKFDSFDSLHKETQLNVFSPPPPPFLCIIMFDSC
jgi:glucuronokinase